METRRTKEQAYDVVVIGCLPGLDSFRGELLHTARWRDDVAIAGQRVAVIGTGATTVQLVPALAPRTARLTVEARPQRYGSQVSCCH